MADTGRYAGPLVGPALDDLLAERAARKARGEKAMGSADKQNPFS